MESSGEEKRQTVRIGGMNRVEGIDYEGLGALDIGYDAMGRAVRFDTGGDVIEVEYAGPDRIARIVSQATGAVWSPVEGGERRPQAADTRREVLQKDRAAPSHPGYGVAAFDGASFAVSVRDPLELGIPGLPEARRLLDVAEPLLSGGGRGAMTEFEKPSNAVFQPLEYRSTNCCICITIVEADLAVAGAADDALRGVRVVCYCLPPSVQSPPFVTLLTRGRIWHIDRKPSMPRIWFEARLHNVENALYPFYLWKLEMEFDGRKKKKTYKHVVTEVTIVPRWSPGWNGLLAGANKMTVTVAVAVDESVLTASKSGYQIHGQNPTQAQIFEIATKLQYKAVSWQESTHRQFNARRHTGIGLPLLGPPDGWGLMQLELGNPNEGWGEDELWNWRENLREGIDYLDTLYGQGEIYLRVHHGRAARDPLIKDWPSNPADDPDNLWDEAFSRYNTGKSLYRDNGNEGVRNCNENQLGCNYVAAVRKHMKDKPWK